MNKKNLVRALKIAEKKQMHDKCKLYEDIIDRIKTDIHIWDLTNLRMHIHIIYELVDTNDLNFIKIETATCDKIRKQIGTTRIVKDEVSNKDLLEYIMPVYLEEATISETDKKQWQRILYDFCYELKYPTFVTWLCI
jgi:hypothetical protein